MAGFGKTGGDKDNVGYGPIIEMMSGLMSLSGYDADAPQKTGISYGDPVAGLAAVGAIALGVIKQRRTGQGSRVDLAQVEVSVKMAGVAFATLNRTGAHAGGHRQPPPDVGAAGLLPGARRGPVDRRQLHRRRRVGGVRRG